MTQTTQLSTAQLKTLSSIQLLQVSRNKINKRGIRARALRSHWMLDDHGKEHSDSECIWRNGEIWEIR